MTTMNSWKMIVVIGAFGLIALLGFLPGEASIAASPTPVPTNTPPIPPPPPPPTPPTPPITKTPPPIYGGEWRDDWFYSEQLSTTTNIWVSDSRLYLRVAESLNWKQTWTAHFALGEFWQTEALSDSVQLARINGSQYFTTGIYTSTIFDAGRSVAWLSANWINTRVTRPITVEFRTGDTIPPDHTWSNWDPSRKLCACRLDVDLCDCRCFRLGIASGRFFQYRVTFSNDDPSRTQTFNEITIAYGIYVPSGTATSRAIPPIDLQSWKEVFYSATVPISTALTIDVLATDGKVLLSSVTSGDSLASIDPLVYPSIQLRATLATDDIPRTPELDLWGVRWFVNTRWYFFPIIFR